MGKRTACRFITACLCIFLSHSAAQADIVSLLPSIKPAIVGVGTLHPLAVPRIRLLGTGFVVADGRHVVTNAHVLPALMADEKGESLAIFVRDGEEVRARKVEKVANDKDHDLALLKLEGDPLPALRLGRFTDVREGQVYYFTGFPVGAALGLYPATHRAGLAAIAPIYSPPPSVKRLTAKLIRQAEDPFLMFQLDAVAYPGNSGSPLYDGETGEVIGVINAVFVKGAKENALKDPTGITYAIPAKYVRALLAEANLQP
jgi:S1-C subfamily serine protease